MLNMQSSALGASLELLYGPNGELDTEASSRYTKQDITNVLRGAPNAKPEVRMHLQAEFQRRITLLGLGTGVVDPSVISQQPRLSSITSSPLDRAQSAVQGYVQQLGRAFSRQSLTWEELGKIRKNGLDIEAAIKKQRPDLLPLINEYYKQIDINDIQAILFATGATAHGIHPNSPLALFGLRGGMEPSPEQQPLLDDDNSGDTSDSQFLASVGYMLRCCGMWDEGSTCRTFWSGCCTTTGTFCASIPGVVGSCCSKTPGWLQACFGAPFNRWWGPLLVALIAALVWGIIATTVFSWAVNYMAFKAAVAPFTTSALPSPGSWVVANGCANFGSSLVSGVTNLGGGAWGYGAIEAGRISFHAIMGVIFAIYAAGGVSLLTCYRRTGAYIPNDDVASSNGSRDDVQVYDVEPRGFGGDHNDLGISLAQTQSHQSTPPTSPRAQSPIIQQPRQSAFDLFNAQSPNPDRLDGRARSVSPRPQSPEETQRLVRSSSLTLSGSNPVSRSPSFLNGLQQQGVNADALSRQSAHSNASNRLRRSGSQDSSEEDMDFNLFD